MDVEKKKQLYEKYKEAGFKIKVYDYPTMQNVGGKRALREFDTEELLFRKPLVVTNKKTTEYYRDKVILITGRRRFHRLRAVQAVSQDETQADYYSGYLRKRRI